jgi:hypothetical protein
MEVLRRSDLQTAPRKSFRKKSHLGGFVRIQCHKVAKLYVLGNKRRSPRILTRIFKDPSLKTLDDNPQYWLAGQPNRVGLAWSEVQSVKGWWAQQRRSPYVRRAKGCMDDQNDVSGSHSNSCLDFSQRS